MKCRVIKLRINGVAVPKYAVKQQPKPRGMLEVIDTREESFNRIIKVARLVCAYPEGTTIHVLYEPHIVWMNEGRFTLAGFERVKRADQEIDFAQSWLCEVEKEEGQ